MITRSGTNDFHGSAFETGRNSGFGVARQRQDTFTKAPHLVRNEFGASLGGPWSSPKLYNGKNRTFFFAAWEEMRNRAGQHHHLRRMDRRHAPGRFQRPDRQPEPPITLYDPWSVGGRAQLHQDSVRQQPASDRAAFRRSRNICSA